MSGNISDLGGRNRVAVAVAQKKPRLTCSYMKFGVPSLEDKGAHDVY